MAGAVNKERGERPIKTHKNIKLTTIKTEQKL